MTAAGPITREAQMTINDAKPISAAGPMTREAQMTINDAKLMTI
jgi:hypothetical protein